MTDLLTNLRVEVGSPGGGGRGDDGGDGSPGGGSRSRQE